MNLQILILSNVLNCRGVSQLASPAVPSHLAAVQSSAGLKSLSAIFRRNKCLSNVSVSVM